MSTMEKEQFYNECAAILNPSVSFEEIKYREHGTNRWGPRRPGNGRFPGIGTVRYFNANLVHVSLSNPVQCKTFSSCEEALEFLRTLHG